MASASTSSSSSSRPGRYHALLLLALELALLGLAPRPTGAAAASIGGGRRLTELYKPPPGDLLRYHDGAVLSGDVPVSVLWYGRFTPAQQAIVTDFLLSLSPAAAPAPAPPSVAQWWGSINRLYLARAAAAAAGKHNGASRGGSARVVLAAQVSDEGCSLGKALRLSQLPALAARARSGAGGVALVLTAQDVAVEGFCASRCGHHGSLSSARTRRAAYAWVGNPAAQCPGQCAWPFHQPAYGPQAPPLAPPNGDVGMDGALISVAAALAGAVTNPFGDGFYQGDRAAPLEAATACAGVYGTGAYPGYAGRLLVDKATGASYNANGARGRKYLLPALYDPGTGACTTLV